MSEEATAAAGGPDLGAIALKLGLQTLKRTAPNGISWLTTYAGGVNLLLVGPTKSGKTSFSDYLVHGVFHPELEHITTLEETKSGTFSVAIGKNEKLSLKVRNSLDQPGQIGPLAHADLVSTRMPHALIVMLDGSQNSKIIVSWLTEFCMYLERNLRNNKKLRTKMKSVIVCLNMHDKVKNKNHFDARHRRVKTVLEKSLSGVLGQHEARAIPVLACASVASKEYGTSLIDAVITTLAKQVKK